MNQTTKCVVYITNDHPFYMVMTANSINMLRKHNKTIPVKVFLVETFDGIESRYMQKPEFLSSCEYLDAKVIKSDPVISDEKDYFPVNKALLARCDEDQILFMDADTFIFGDIDSIFDKYSEYDFVACENVWVNGKSWRKELISHGIKPMNSGVMLWKQNWLKKACAYLPEGCKQLREGNDPLAKWLKDQNQIWCREEFTFTDFAAANHLKLKCFDREDCYNILIEQDIERCWESTVFHSYSKQWKAVFKYLKTLQVK